MKKLRESTDAAFYCLSARRFRNFESWASFEYRSRSDLEFFIQKYVASSTKEPKVIHLFVLITVISQLGDAKEGFTCRSGFFERLWSLAPESNEELREAIWDVGGCRVLPSTLFETSSERKMWDEVREEAMKISTD